MLVTEKLVSNVVLVREIETNGVLTPPSTSVTNKLAQLLRQPQLASTGEQSALGHVRLLSARDQISLDLSMQRLTIEDQTDDQPFSERFWKITRDASSIVGWNFRPFGFNFKLVAYHPGHTAESLIDSIFLAERAAERLSREAHVGTVTFTIPTSVGDAGRYSWKIKVEPRFDEPDSNSTYIDGNVHLDDAWDPNRAEEISSDLWNDFLSIVNSLAIEQEA